MLVEGEEVMLVVVVGAGGLDGLELVVVGKEVAGVGDVVVGVGEGCVGDGVVGEEEVGVDDGVGVGGFLEW